MLTYIVRRLLISVPTIVFVSIVVFGLQLLLPGDPALALAGEERDPQVIAELRRMYHLDEPIWRQYLIWVGNVLNGNLGESIRLKMPVGELVAAKLPVTMQLASMAILIAICIGIPMGIISAVKKETLLDYGANVVALSGISVPSFWLGIMMILLFSVNLGWLPASGFVKPSESLSQNLQTMIMPAIVLSSVTTAIFMRHTRSAMLAVLRSDYVRTARAKGLREPRVVFRHALRNAIIPVVTLGAIQLGELMSGAVLTEQIFTIPGFGKLIVDAVFNRDYAVVQGVVLCTATGFIFLNLCADLIYFLVNPRMRG
ncbi:MAG: ABC transporter permease [Rhodospirillaceae bacterium]|jgi:peptide/nickel transport system permease protein|nr:ABC transporter permease [Rhodospirillaceae bacterium]